MLNRSLFAALPIALCLSITLWLVALLAVDVSFRMNGRSLKHSVMTRLVETAEPMAMLFHGGYGKHHGIARWERR